MICSNCGTQNKAGRRFCAECGSPLALACPACGAVVEPGEKFCGACGAHLVPTGSSTSSARMAGPSATEGVRAPSGDQAPAGRAERRVVTILFADLVGFTSLAAERDPEAVRELLTRYFVAAREIIERYGGTIEKFIGDAVMAVWGAPVAHEDDAERAVRAALDLVVAVPRLSDPSVGLELRLRAAVLTGEAAVTPSATGEGFVAGDLVNTASRLQSVAPPGSVLVGEATRRAASGAIAFEEAGEQVLRGKAAPVPAYRALRVVGERGGHGAAEGLEPPFVGREDELRLLRELFHTTGRERRARLVSIIGQAGLGKSRLAWELEKYLDGVVETVYWHAGRSPAYGSGIAFWALGEMIRRRARLTENADERTTRAAIAEMLVEFVADSEERRWIEPRLLMLLGVGDAPSGGREELFAAWRTLFERIAERGTTALVFEDLHWADSGLLDFIEHLLEWSRSLPIFILTLARPELLDRRPGWGTAQPSALALRLEPLGPEPMRELLHGLVPGLPERAADRILARADGIPLYAVETVRMLVADGRLAVETGAYRPTVDLSSLEVPDSLVALVGARLDGLDAADRTLVQDASVLGQRFTTAALAAVSGLDAEDAERRLRALVRREILVLESDPRSPERGQHGFVQAVVREVAYSTLARRDRRTRHLAAARYFESLGDEELAGALAQQYLAAWRALPDGPEGDAAAAQARISLRAAADRAVALGSFEQAITHLEDALAVAGGLAAEAVLLQRIGEIAILAGLPDRAEHVLRRAVELARTLGDRALAVRATADLAVTMLVSAHIGPALAVLEPVMDEALALGDHVGVAHFASALANALMRSGRYGESVEWADRAILVAERQELEEVVGQALVTKATALAHVGRRREGMALLDGATRFAEDRGFNLIALRGQVNFSANESAEDPRAALEYVRRGVALSQRLGIRTLLPYHVGNGYGAALRTGDWAWFEAMAQEVLAILRDPASAPWTRRRLAAIALWRGVQPGTEFEDEMREAKAEGDPQTMAYAALALGQTAYVDGDFAQCAQVIEAGMSDRAAWPYVTAFGGRAAILVGDLDRAQRALAAIESVGSYGALGADSATLRAGINALEGRRVDALAGYRTALSRYRELGLRFDEALTATEIVALIGPAGPDVVALADAAKAILVDLGAHPILGRLEGLLAGAEDSTRIVDGEARSNVRLGNSIGAGADWRASSGNMT